MAPSKKKSAGLECVQVLVPVGENTSSRTPGSTFEEMACRIATTSPVESTSTAAGDENPHMVFSGTVKRSPPAPSSTMAPSAACAATTVPSGDTEIVLCSDRSGNAATETVRVQRNAPAEVSENTPGPPRPYTLPAASVASSFAPP